MEEIKATILVIDDEESMRDSCVQILSKGGYRAETAKDGSEGLEKIKKLKPDLNLIDLKMPGISGMEVLEKAQEIDPNIINVVITGYATVESAVQAMKKGAYDFLPKPFTPEQLRIIIRRGLEKRKLTQETETLRQEKKKMEENFVTMVSHQLRSPLVAIVQYFEVILGGMVGELQEQQKKMIQKAKQRAESLLKLINDWLSIARMEKQDIVQKRKSLSLEKLISNLTDFYQPVAQEKKVSLEVSSPSGSDQILGDKETLEQVFSNLINNAIKYNKPNGQVQVSFEEKDGSVATHVKDTGEGISQENIPLLFEQFYRVNRSEDKKSKGSGLGLAIAKKIVDLHEGSIDVQSEVGKGSDFIVSLPKAGKEKEPQG
ncbi:response regulator, partial [bacterium]|nr:response regulator [bacterium]